MIRLRRNATERDFHSPKPSLPLIVCSAIVLAACGLVTSGLIATLAAVAWDPCSLFGAGFLLPFPLMLAAELYRGVFRRNASAAHYTAIFLFVCGGLALFGFAMSLGETLLENGQLPPLPLCATLLAIGVGATLAGWLSRRWSQRLKMFAVDETKIVATTRFSMRELIGAVAAVACIAAVSAYFIRKTPPQYAQHVSRDQAPFGLPENAIDISFCQGFRGTIAYEFTTTESAFVDWVNSGIGSFESQAANVSLRPISPQYTIQRFCSLSTDLKGQELTTIAKGLYYDWSKEDRRVKAAFDRTSNRAYYFASFH